MAEEQGVEEQQQESEEQEETSRLGRLKGQLKKVVGKDSDEDEERSGQEEDSQDGAQASGEDDSGDEEGSEGGDNSEEYVGEYKVDDVDMDKHANDEDEARAQIRKLQKEGPPDQLADWPRGKAMYLTFGGAEGEEGYEDGVARQMGPSSTRHLADGSVEVQGETADDPSEYKRDESVGEEAEKIGMDKGAKTEGEDSDDDSQEESSGEGSSDAQAEGEGSSDAQAEGEGSSDAQAEGEDSGHEHEESDQEEEQAARS